MSIQLTRIEPGRYEYAEGRFQIRKVKSEFGGYYYTILDEQKGGLLRGRTRRLDDVRSRIATKLKSEG